MCEASQLRAESFIKGFYDVVVMTMTDIDTIANQLKSLSAKQLSQLLSATSNRDGSQIRAKRNARTQKYFEHAPKPHQCLTFENYRDTVSYIHEIGVDQWLTKRGSL